MTNEEIIAKAYEKYPERDVNGVDIKTQERVGYFKALTEINELPKIEGWVAREKDGCLCFWGVKPDRWQGDGILFDGKIDDHWFVPGACRYMCFGYSKMFPELKWEDEPKKVELIIREV